MPRAATATILQLHRAVEAERQRSPRAADWPAPLALVEHTEPPTRAEQVIKEAADRPVETAVREHVRTIGYALASQGGFKRMQAAWGAVAEQDGRAAAWLDKAWDGIAVPDGRWCA